MAKYWRVMPHIIKQMPQSEFEWLVRMHNIESFYMSEKKNGG